MSWERVSVMAAPARMKRSKWRSTLSAVASASVAGASGDDCPFDDTAGYPHRNRSHKRPRCGDVRDMRPRRSELKIALAQSGWPRLVWDAAASSRSVASLMERFL